MVHLDWLWRPIIGTRRVTHTAYDTLLFTLISLNCSEVNLRRTCLVEVYINASKTKTGRPVCLIKAGWIWVVELGFPERTNRRRSLRSGGWSPVEYSSLRITVRNPHRPLRHVPRSPPRLVSRSGSRNRVTMRKRRKKRGNTQLSD